MNECFHATQLPPSFFDFPIFHDINRSSTYNVYMLTFIFCFLSFILQFHYSCAQPKGANTSPLNCYMLFNPVRPSFFPPEHVIRGHLLALIVLNPAEGLKARSLRDAIIDSSARASTISDPKSLSALEELSLAVVQLLQPENPPLEYYTEVKHVIEKTLRRADIIKNWDSALREPQAPNRHFIEGRLNELAQEPRNALKISRLRYLFHARTLSEEMKAEKTMLFQEIVNDLDLNHAQLTHGIYFSLLTQGRMQPLPVALENILKARISTVNIEIYTQLKRLLEQQD